MTDTAMSGLGVDTKAADAGAGAKATGARKKAEKENKYPVLSIEKIAPPKGADGNWYQYIIGKGNSQITGSRRGTLRQVTTYANNYAKSLNERCGGKGGGYAWARSSKKKKSKAAG